MDASGETSPKTGSSGNWGNLPVRAGSALVIAAVAFVCLYFGDWIWTAFMILVGARAAFEFGRMSQTSTDRENRAWVLVFVSTVTIILWSVFSPDMARTLLLTVVGAAAISFLVSVLVKSYERNWISLGFIYIVIPMVAAIWLRGGDAGVDATGFQRLLFIGLTVIAADAGAYFAGKTIGGPKLAPRISPNKTWAGFIGGLVAGALVGSAYAAWAGADLVLAVVVALLVVVASVAGDFLESAFKRRFGVKDSGSIFPGHGGVLDRIDSHMAAITLYALLALLAPQILPL